ncbi:MFS transporter [Blautia stercoris]|uniref:MFS transporter n=1 Tax=Blautia stercoris TaxID=871664 RepID=A0ABR7PCF4_9FIRM|nr:MFS transporter [Blautia stercoris]MBC8629084.1 MFS transporter [Blautia stercoris]
MESKARKYLTIIALGLAGGSIYFIPYVKYVFYDAQLAAMGINNTQSGLLLTMYTIGNMVLYIPGGYLADKVSTKKALIISLVATSVLTWVYAFSLNFVVSMIIWLGLSFSTAFVFWSALMKAVRIVGTEEEQGFMYGLYYACNGIAAALTSFISLYAYNTAGEDIKSGFVRGVNASGVVVLIAAICLVFLMKEDAGKVTTESDDDKISLPMVGKVLKSPVVWILSIVILCGYGLKSSVSYFNPYLTEVVGVSAVNSGIFSIINNYLLLLLAPVGGILADKVFKSTCKWLSVSFVILAVLFGGVLLIPSDISPMVASIYTLLPGAVTMMMYGVVFSSVSEAGISRTMTGTVIGISSIIGYLPDSIYSVIFGKWLDNKGAAGYTNIFIFLVASGIVGAVLAFWIYRHGKRAQHDA